MLCCHLFPRTLLLNQLKYLNSKELHSGGLIDLIVLLAFIIEIKKPKWIVNGNMLKVLMIGKMNSALPVEAQDEILN